MTDHNTAQGASQAFIDIAVTISPPSHSGHGYTVHYQYPTPNGNGPALVYTPNTVFRFILVETPASIQFVGMTSTRAHDPAIKPGHAQRLVPQLSPYSISLDRRALICSDVYNDFGFINVTLQWIDGVFFTDDPQVGNVPIPPAEKRSQ